MTSINRQKTILRACCVFAACVYLYVLLDLWLSHADFVAAVEKGLEQRVYPGSTSPIWVSPESVGNPLGGTR